MVGKKLTVSSNIRAYLETKGLRMSKEFEEAVEGFLYRSLDRATIRAKLNHRSTVLERDL